MANGFKIISALLSYPSKDLIDAGPELRAALAADTMVGKKEKKRLGALIDDLVGRDIYDAQERYVLLFDRTRSISLHLFEHVHGESRDRGQAMVDLANLYEARGFEVDAKELPDYLPLFLEFLSTQPAPEALSHLGQILHIVSAVRQRLQQRKTLYANGFLALESIAGAKPDAEAVALILKNPEDDPNDLQALDKIWEDEVVTFGGGAGNDSCASGRLRTQMRAIQRSATSPEIQGEH